MSSLPRSGSLVFRMKMAFQKGSGTTVEDLQRCFVWLGKLKVVHEGWLLKRGKVMHTWKRRYFLLVYPGVILYLENERGVPFLKSLRVQTSGNSGSSSAVKRAVEQALAAGVLGSIMVVHKDTLIESKEEDFENYSNVFTVQAPAPSNRLFYLAADTDAEVEAWKQKIESTRSSSSRASTIDPAFKQPLVPTVDETLPKFPDTAPATRRATEVDTVPTMLRMYSNSDGDRVSTDSSSFLSVLPARNTSELHIPFGGSIITGSSPQEIISKIDKSMGTSDTADADAAQFYGDFTHCLRHTLLLSQHAVCHQPAELLSQILARFPMVDVSELKGVHGKAFDFAARMSQKEILHELRKRVDKFHSFLLVESNGGSINQATVPSQVAAQDRPTPYHTRFLLQSPSVDPMLNVITSQDHIVFLHRAVAHVFNHEDGALCFSLRAASILIQGEPPGNPSFESASLDDVNNNLMLILRIEGPAKSSFSLCSTSVRRWVIQFSLSELVVLTTSEIVTRHDRSQISLTQLHKRSLAVILSKGIGNDELMVWDTSDNRRAHNVGTRVASSPRPTHTKNKQSTTNRTPFSPSAASMINMTFEAKLRISTAVLLDEGKTVAVGMKDGTLALWKLTEHTFVKHFSYQVLEHAFLDITPCSQHPSIVIVRSTHPADGAFVLDTTVFDDGFSVERLARLPFSIDPSSIKFSYSSVPDIIPVVSVTTKGLEAAAVKRDASAPGGIAVVAHSDFPHATPQDCEIVETVRNELVIANYNANLLQVFGLDENIVPMLLAAPRPQDAMRLPSTPPKVTSLASSLRGPYLAEVQLDEKEGQTSIIQHDFLSRTKDTILKTSESILCIDLSPDGSYLLALLGSGLLRLYNCKDGAERCSLHLGDKDSRMERACSAINSDGSVISVITEVNGFQTVSILHTQQDNLTLLQENTLSKKSVWHAQLGKVLYMSITLDHTSILIVTDRAVTVWGIAESAFTRNLIPHRFGDCVKAASFGSMVFLAGTQINSTDNHVTSAPVIDHRVVAINMDSGEVLTAVAFTNPIQSLNFDPYSNSLLVTAGLTVYVLNAPELDSQRVYFSLVTSFTMDQILSYAAMCRIPSSVEPVPAGENIRNSSDLIMVTFDRWGQLCQLKYAE